MTEASVRTVLRMRAREGCEAEFEAAWRRAASDISRVPGNVAQELTRDLGDPRAFLITADWVDRGAVDAFGRSAARETLTAALRDLREEASRTTYELVHAVPGQPPLPVRIDLSTAVAPGEEDAFERAYEIVTSRLRGTKGLIREELLREPDSGRYHIFAEWETEEDFLDWVEDPSHADQSGPLARWLSVDFRRQTFEVRFRPPEYRSTAAEPGIPSLSRRPYEAPASDAPRTVVGEPEAARPEPAPAVVAQPGGGTADAVPEATGPARTAVESPSTDLALAAAAVASTEAPPTIVPGEAAPPTVDAPPEPRPVVTPAPRGATGRVTTTAAVDVVVVGAGPAGLTHAIELARRGIAVRVVDKAPEASAQADKAIGIHCRTMEIWEDQGVVAAAMDAGTWLHGQTVYVNQKLTHQVDWANLPELPYAHLGLPQFETERLLTDRLAALGVRVERGVEVLGFAQDDDGVDVELRSADGSTAVERVSYLVGCDGAHSVVRSTLGLQFEGGLAMFPQLFMLADVDLDWQQPEGHLVRYVRIEDDGDFTGMLVCVPLKGAGRYRLATLAPQELQKTIGAGRVAAGFWQEYTPPGLAEIQAVLDDLVPGTTASNLRWSSVFRIKHGIVDHYRRERVFVAGDAAHLHPPAGGQGMNTGIQDAWNLGWKLALAVRGQAAPGLLDSYEAERRPAGQAIVDRAVAVAFTDEMDMEDEKAQFLLEMQMTMNYAGSPLVGEEVAPDRPLGGPEPGHRAPDATGLRRFGVAHDLRVFDLTRGPHATLLLYVDETASEDDVQDLEKLASAARQQSGGQVVPYLVASPAARLPALADLPVVQDSAGAFRGAYGLVGAGAYLVREDGHVGHRSSPPSGDALAEHLRLTYAGS